MTLNLTVYFLLIFLSYAFAMYNSSLIKIITDKFLFIAAYVVDIIAVANSIDAVNNLAQKLSGPHANLAFTTELENNEGSFRHQWSFSRLVPKG